MRAFDKSSLLEYRRIVVQRSTAPVANSFQKWIEGLKVTVFSKTYCSEYATRSTRSAILTILRLSCHRGLSFRHAELNCLQQLVAQCDKMHSTQRARTWTVGQIYRAVRGPCQTKIGITTAISISSLYHPHLRILDYFYWNPSRKHSYHHP